MKATKTTTIKKTETIELDYDDLKEMLFKSKLIDKNKNIRHICIYMHVPVDGDWSSTALEVYDDTSLYVSIVYDDEVQES